jgi:hypothetical protein
MDMDMNTETNRNIGTNMIPVTDMNNLQKHQYVGATESQAPNKWCYQFAAPMS